MALPIKEILSFCGSELAREGVNTVNIFIDWPTAIASRLAPTGDVQWLRICYRKRAHVGASLLAMTICQPVEVSKRIGAPAAQACRSSIICP
ncbi:hypothetical protein SAMN05216476_3610 [Pseudomonas mediterranea]|uniref:Uncharacterized protein n=1 Tax=Pseudomonas mediterranea TaxID=183795 RepID=A0AAX2DE51_9PSED|nr:hypothetical protein SAMN05216476_3610 [Pseudomonas mediterranea]